MRLRKKKPENKVVSRTIRLVKQMYVSQPGYAHGDAKSWEGAKMTPSFYVEVVNTYANGTSYNNTYACKLLSDATLLYDQLVEAKGDPNGRDVLKEQTVQL